MELLFKDRVPEAAARQLACVLASATESHLELLSEMQEKARTPKGVLARQVDLCKLLVAHCVDLGVDPKWGIRGKACLRLKAAISAARATDTMATTESDGGARQQET